MSNIKKREFTMDDIASKLLRFLAGQHTDQLKHDGIVAALNFVKNRTERRIESKFLKIINEFESDETGGSNV